MILEEETYKNFGYYSSDLKPKSKKRILVACDECGKIREITSRQYCALCRSCAKKGIRNPMYGVSFTGKKHPNWQGGPVERKCLECGKSFYTTHSKSKNGYGKYCSRECMAIVQSKRNIGRNNPNWQGGKKNRTCQECGNDFEAGAYTIKNGYGNFCSISCARHARITKQETRDKISEAMKGRVMSEITRKKISESKKGNKNPSWKGGLVTRICKECGDMFFVPPSEIRKGSGNFCSRSCARKHRKFPTHHTKPERIFEDICKRNNLPFHYVGDGQLWIGNKGQKQLNPDFIEVNGKKVCIEVFGDYWHSPLLNKKIKEHGRLDYRKQHYRRYKWHPIFLWESDILREDAEAFILTTLKKEKVI